MRNLFVIWWCWLTGRGVHFLKCDAKGCNYIEFHKCLDVGMVDKLCPLCRSNLLTQEDYYNFICLAK